MEISNVLLLSLNIMVLIGVAGIVYLVIAIAKTARKVNCFVDWMNSVQPELEKSIHVFQEVVTDIRDFTGAAKRITLPALNGLEAVKHAVQGLFSRVKTIFSSVSGVSVNGNSREQSAQVKKESETYRG